MDHKEYMERRAIDIAHYIINNNATVRQAAYNFMIGKSTVHKDMTERLVDIDSELASKVREVLNINLNDRHNRGGLATKMRYRGDRYVK